MKEKRSFIDFLGDFAGTDEESQGRLKNNLILIGIFALLITILFVCQVYPGLDRIIQLFSLDRLKPIFSGGK